MRHAARVIFFLIILFSATNLKAQYYYNQWINYNQVYYKFPVTSEGVYHIDSLALSSKLNLSGINPKNFQVFFAGKEQFLYIKGEADGAVNTGDYLEVYLNPLNCNIDSTIYTGIKYLPNPYLPIFNDTVWAYVTLNNSFSNKRYTLQTDTTWSNYSAAQYVYNQQVYSPYNTYNQGDFYASWARDPRYIQNEGYGYAIYKGSSLTTPFSNLNTYTSSPLPCYINVSYSGMSVENTGPVYDHEVSISYLNSSSSWVSLHDTLFYGFIPVKKTFTINSTNANNTNIQVTSVSNPTFSFSNTTLINYMSYFYPSYLKANAHYFYRFYADDNTSSSKGVYVFSAPPTAFSKVTVLDPTNGNKMLNIIQGGNLKFILPNTGGRKLLIIATEDNATSTISVTTLSTVNNSLPFTFFNSSSITNPYIIIYNDATKNGAVAYKNYRQSSAGGSFNVVMANIEELYHQFAYGNRKHAAAIRNFVKYLKDSLPLSPKYVFLIGKGIKMEDIEAGKQADNLIPAMGRPTSDVLLTAGLTPTSATMLYPDIPIGRLPALNDNDVMVYLNKIQQHESAPEAIWKKNVLHFPGGDTPQLSNYLELLMSGYATIIKDTLFGANVTTFSKNSTAPVQTVVSDSIYTLINNGCSLMTFFGHGSDQGFDISVDDPTLYNNTGKYPMVIANSCYSGNMYIFNNRSVSENFVLTNQKGSLGFLAASDLGFPYALNYYTTNFYTALGKTKYNQGLGDMTKEACYRSTLVQDSITKFTALDMALNADPAVKVSLGMLPDYAISNNSVGFDTKKYTDSIGVFIYISNLGRARNDTFYVGIERTYANGDSTLILKKFHGPYYYDSLKFYMPTDFSRGIGLNKFKIKVDYYSAVTEVTKSNNTVGPLDVFINGGDIIPVYPYQFAVVQKTNTLTLKASTSNPFAPQTIYRLQLDTCDKFLAPIQTTVITSKGGVIEWSVNLPFKDSTVYFWRASRDSLSPLINFNWRQSSFQTINTQRGWGQAHFHQFKNDGYQFVNYNYTARNFNFKNNKIGIACKNGISPFIAPVSIGFSYNSMNLTNWGCAPDGWSIALFDSISGAVSNVISPIAGVTPGPYNNCICGDINQNIYAYSFGNSNYCGLSNWQNSLDNFLTSIPPNTYVLAYTVGKLTPHYAQMNTYSNSLYSNFESIGAKQIRYLSDTVPYILFGKKGMGFGNGNEVYGKYQNSVIQLKDSITTRWNSGYIASSQIGPAFNWGSLHWRVQSIDVGAGDTTVLKVLGIKMNGQTDTVATFSKDSLDVQDLSNYVNATVYPYIKLIAFMKDNVYHTSPQLKRWQVLYSEAPECAINPLKGFSTINDTLQEGDNVSFRFPIQNIGYVPFNDSLVITYWIEDASKNTRYLPQKMKVPPFAPGQVIVDTLKLNSYQLAGNNALWIYVNPISNSKYQNEQYQFNNIGRYPFQVNKDVTNPLIDVTFDGVRILNGDIVSAKPNILVTLKDENQFLALNDTSAFTVTLLYPNQSIPQRVYFANGLIFTPASLPKNSCSILYNPSLLQDGRYTFNVQSRDRSNNRGTINTYQVQFEIVNKPTITNILNYPNPFTTSTHFVFTITGSDVPEVFSIQIMTITGKVVKEIMREELGHLHIGRNITDYAWDGRDMYGDRLANGVYLYKITTKLNGQNIDHASTSADKYFVKDFGKMVLMR
ncbi:MAG: hypothetical protein JSU07_11945 [Bacteroidetes bacterium]|nr:hypothetical protein [Bacteroidota bacterium]